MRFINSETYLLSSQKAQRTLIDPIGRNSMKQCKVQDFIKKQPCKTLNFSKICKL